MSEIKIVSLEGITNRRSKAYEPFIQAALNMERGKAVLVERIGIKSLTGNVNRAIWARNLRDKLAVKTVKGLTYIIHLEDK